MQHFQLAIDGPGGAGKSSVAKILAEKLHAIYVDTGAMYRSVALFMLRREIDMSDRARVIAALPQIHLQYIYKKGQILLCNGEEMKEQIRTPEVSMAASAVSAIPEVRSFLLETQRNVAQNANVIMDGRDIGTVILPNADLKIFLIASPEARAKRRYLELCEKGAQTTYEEVLAQMKERDENDAGRAVAPCVPARDAHVLDNSALTLEETAEKISDMLEETLNEKKNMRNYMRTYRWMAPLVRFLFGMRMHGRENIPEGGLLVCANHIAVRDVFLVAASFRRPVRFLAKKELFSMPILKTLVPKFGAVSVDRKGENLGAIRTAVDLLKKDNAVAIFPQGHRYPGVDPAKTEPKNGAALIAYHAKVPVLPVYLKTKGYKYGLFRHVDVIIGKPIPYEELGFEKGGNEEYARASRLIFDRIISLSDAGEEGKKS